MRTLESAISFLTIFRVGSHSSRDGRGAIWFPLVGAAMGAMGAAIFIGAGRVMPWPLAALLTTIFWAGISRVPREQGRIGTLGAITIGLGIVARWLALDHLVTSRVWEALIASQAVPRAVMVALAWISRPPPTGAGLTFLSTLSTPAAIGAIAQGVVSAFCCGILSGTLILAGGYVVIRALQMLSYQRAGGVNADGLGATEQLMEIYILVLFACRDCV